LRLAVGLRIRSTPLSRPLQQSRPIGRLCPNVLWPSRVADYRGPETRTAVAPATVVLRAGPVASAVVRRFEEQPTDADRFRRCQDLRRTALTRLAPVSDVSPRLP